jgi:hypothetical protein
MQWFISLSTHADRDSRQTGSAPQSPFAYSKQLVGAMANPSVKDSSLPRLERQNASRSRGHDDFQTVHRDRRMA